MDEYFACKRTIFDVPLLAVGTEFQRTVWQELQNIPYGKTVSYGELSRKLGNPKAVRAVAAANGANALSILIPCHRVVGSNHTLIAMPVDWQPNKGCWHWKRTLATDRQAPV